MNEVKKVREKQKRDAPESASLYNFLYKN